MDLNKKLITRGAVLLGISVIVYTIGFLVFNNHVKELNLVWVFFILMLVFMCLHQIGAGWVLYQFAVTRKKMSNKIHLFNRISVGVSLGFTGVFLVMVQWAKLPLNDSAGLVMNALVLILMAGYVFIQENNTNNFVYFNFHKKLKISKKEYNQIVGFLTNWIAINIIWLSFAFGLRLPLMLLLYCLLILIQNSLSYTTYGQSKYWNFSYEVILIGHIGALGLVSGKLIVLIIGLIIGGLFILRQWREMEYKAVAYVAGLLIYVFGALVLIINPFGMKLAKEWISDGLPMVFSVILLTFAIAYFINNPKFLAGLNKK